MCSYLKPIPSNVQGVAGCDMSLYSKADMLLLTYNAIYSPAHKLKISETETLLTVCYHLLLCLHLYWH